MLPRLARADARSLDEVVAGPDDAPALVLLHGWGASKEIWRHVLRAPLVDRYRVIALDMPGTGSTPVTEPCTMETMADWLEGEVDRLGLNRFSLLGHSMGGNVAARFAARCPERLSALVLVSAALQSNRLTAANWYLHPVTGPMTLGGGWLMAGVAGWVESRMPPLESPGWARGYARRSGYLMAHNNLPNLRSTLQALLTGPFDPADLPGELPILIMHGARDSTVPLSWAQETFAQRPVMTELLVYNTALHCPMDTHTQNFVDDLVGFLDRNVVR